MKNSVAEQCRGSKGDHKGIDVLVDAMKFSIFIEQREDKYSEQGAATDENHHEKSITIGWGRIK